MILLSLVLLYFEPCYLPGKKNPLRRWMYFGDGWKTKGTHKCWLGGLWVKDTFTIAFFVWMRYHTESNAPTAAVNPHISQVDEWVPAQQKTQKCTLRRLVLKYKSFCVLGCLFLIHIFYRNTILHISSTAWDWYSRSCPSHRMGLSLLALLIQGTSQNSK